MNRVFPDRELDEEDIGVEGTACAKICGKWADVVKSVESAVSSDGR